MKLNQFVLLGASFLVGIAPVSYAVAVQSPAQTTSQTSIASDATLAQAEPVVAIATGVFVAGEAPTTGNARIITEDGHRYLELDEGFSTSSMGPDLHVLLETTDQPPQSYENLGSAINLGSLHDFTGAQRYPIPDSVDVASFNSVVVWCRMANATFGYAPLNPTSSASIQ